MPPGVGKQQIQVEDLRLNGEVHFIAVLTLFLQLWKVIQHQVATCENVTVQKIGQHKQYNFLYIAFFSLSWFCAVLL